MAEDIKTEDGRRETGRAMFLTIYTPTFRRPRLLALCEMSVKAQTCQDFEHLVYHDLVGEGFAGMFARVVRSAVNFKGDYFYILQDDDRLSDECVVEDVRQFAERSKWPPVIICKNRKATLMLPLTWEAAPKCGQIDLGSYIIRRDIFLEYREGLLSGRYQADFDFIWRIWASGVRFAWYKRLIAESDQFGRGIPEEIIRK